MDNKNEPVKYSEAAGVLKKIHDNIERDIARLLANPNQVDVYRVVLNGRKAQLRSADIAVSVQRLYLQFKGAKPTRKIKASDIAASNEG